MGSGYASPATKTGGSPSIWDAQHRMRSIQVVGAAGAVGRELVGALLRAGHPGSNLVLFGREAGALRWKGQDLPVHVLGHALPGADLAFLCTPPELGKRLAPVLLGAGTRIIDLSGGNRWREDVPMLLPGIAHTDLGPFTLHVTLPGRSSAIAARPLWEIDRAFGVREIQLVVLRSAAAEGAQGILALRAQEGKQVHGRVGNLIPGGGRALVDGTCSAETEILWDLRHLFLRSDLPLEVSVVEAGVERCDGVIAHVELEKSATPAEVKQLLGATPGLRVDLEEHSPTALSAEGSDHVHVGRIRTGSRGPGSLCFFAVGDQLRLGAAAHALSVAADLLACG